MPVRLSAALVREHVGPYAASVLDIGCGTAKLLAALPPRYRCRVGVDLLPNMIDYARRAYPSVEVRVADARTLDLAETFDVVLCVGLTLSYLHTFDDLVEALATIKAHTHPGSVVILQALVAPPPLGQVTSSVSLKGNLVRVNVSYAWTDQIVTMTRTWTFPDGREVSRGGLVAASPE